MVSYGAEADKKKAEAEYVLILIVMDNGLLRRSARLLTNCRSLVLILIVMDNGLLQRSTRT